MLDREFFKAMGIRALKTFAQSAVSLITVGQAFLDVSWVNVISISLTAAIVSCLTSLAGLPEVEAPISAQEQEMLKEHYTDDRSGE